jgi:hypothetical protein
MVSLKVSRGPLGVNDVYRAGNALVADGPSITSASAQRERLKVPSKSKPGVSVRQALPILVSNYLKERVSKHGPAGRLNRGQPHTLWKAALRF